MNDSKPEWVIASEVVAKEINKAAVAVACLGLTFKANIDDLRESPSLEIAYQLARDSGLKVMAVEPNIETGQFNNALLQLYPLKTALAEADIVLLLVDHENFSNLTLSELRGKRLIDTRGLVAVTRAVCRMSACPWLDH